LTDSSKPKFVDSTKRPLAEIVKSEKQAMEAVLKVEREGWTRITTTMLQYVRPTGYGFVTRIRGQWEWFADRVGQPRVSGNRQLLESAINDVEQEINP